ncbi:hypothetical protein LSH36_353g06046, partial [Paralvinella palmiformis]
EYPNAGEGQDWGNPPLKRIRSDNSVFIVGGEQARPREFPWQVSLEDRTEFHFCGASVLNQRYIITAAHCTDGKQPAQIIAVTGKVRRTDTGVKYSLLEIKQHENYRPLTIQNDISLLHTADTIVLDSTAEPICSPSSSSADYTGNKLTVSGWGTISYGGVQSIELRFANVYGISETACSRAYPGSITTDMMCADSVHERDACQGDSGGPLVYKNPSTGAFELAGLVSWGVGCATNPGVYTRVTHFLSWIAANAV